MSFTACAGSTSQSAGPSAQVVTPEPTGTTASPSGGASTATAPVDFADLASLHLDLTTFADGFQAPLYVTSAGDGTGRMYVVEQGGRIRLVQSDGRVESQPFLDISDRVRAGGEQGLLGLAFHPGYRLNGRFFVYYTAGDGQEVVAEFHASGSRADAASEKLILRMDDPYSNHNGGWIAFGPDRFLYIATGDGGAGGDPHNNGQNLNALLGKMLRIDVDHGSPYGIPSGNPYAKQNGKRGEIWDYGLRNPWRNSFDRDTGDLFIGDVGQNRFEEIDLQPAGKGGLNFGWRITEGNACYPQDPCEKNRLTAPVVSYGRDQGSTVTGGYVYRGKASPFFVGAYVFGDFGSGRIWAFRASDAANGAVQPVQILESGLSISSFGEDEDGEIYVCDLAGGTVYKLALATD